MTTDNRTNEPTSEQVEAAAKAIHGLRHPDCGCGEYNVQELRASRAALVAAQGAAPQAEAPRDLLVLAKHLHGRYGRNQPRIWERLSGELQAGWLIEAENVPNVAPVLPSSGVDEDKLAEVLREAEQSWHLSDEKSQQSYACGAPDLKSKYIARAVAEWLKGEK